MRISKIKQTWSTSRNPPAANKISMNPVELVKDKREEILRIAAAHGAKNVRVFGSVVRNEAGDESDIDFLVDLEPGHFSCACKGDER